MKLCQFAKTVFSIAFTLSGAYTFAGPFGLEKGMTADELRNYGTIQSTKDKYRFRSESLNEGYPDAEFYSFVITPKKGLCKITVVTRDHQTSIYGNELKEKFYSLKDALERKYSTPKVMDRLRVGSIWDEPRDWMMGLLKKERTLSAFWINMALPDAIEAIQLEATALSTSKGYLTISYQFDNFKECLEEISQMRNANL